jgi:hypothetical protein
MIKMTPLFAALMLAFAANGPAFATPDRPIIERPAKAERAERPEKAEKAEKVEKSERPEKA